MYCRVLLTLPAEKNKKKNREKNINMFEVTIVLFLTSCMTGHVVMQVLINNHFLTAIHMGWRIIPKREVCIVKLEPCFIVTIGILRHNV